MDIMESALNKHKEWKGKIEIVSRVSVNSRDELSHAYTPGVARPCLEIEKNPELSYELTRRHNLVAVITAGTAVLGLGDICLLYTSYKTYKVMNCSAVSENTVYDILFFVI